MLPLLLLAGLVGSSVGGPFWYRLEDPDCSETPDGVVWLGGCSSFGVCRNGSYNQTDCTNGAVVDIDNLECTDNIESVPFPCNQPVENCSVHALQPGYRVPLMRNDPGRSFPNCRAYYTCVYGKFLAFQWCPEGTVYDEMNQRCSEPIKVPPPCGLALGSPLLGQGQGPAQLPAQAPDQDGGPTNLPARNLFGAGQYQQGVYGQRQNWNNNQQFQQDQNQNSWGQK